MALREIFIERINVTIHGLIIVFSDKPLDYFEYLPGGKPYKNRSGDSKKWFFPNVWNCRILQNDLLLVPMKNNMQFIPSDTAEYRSTKLVSIQNRIPTATQSPYFVNSTLTAIPTIYDNSIQRRLKN